MAEERQIPVLKISPYIRYVNDIVFEAGHTVRERVIYDHEFIYGLRGEAVMTYGDEVYRFGQSDLFYLKPNVRNVMHVEAGKSFHAHCVHFDWVPREERYNFTADDMYLRRAADVAFSFINALTSLPTDEVSDVQLPPLMRGLAHDRLAPLFRELYRHYRAGDLVSQAMARAVFLRIVGEVLAHRISAQEAHGDGQRQATIDEAAAYLRRHFSQPITTPVLAARYALSPKYFGVLFKKITGVSVQAYLLNIRMQQAKHYLLETDDTLEEIAERVGMSDVFYFTKLFKRHEGMPPGRYRRMLSGFGTYPL